MGLEATVKATVAFLDKAVKPVMVVGPRLRMAKGSGMGRSVRGAGSSDLTTKGIGIRRWYAQRRRGGI
jgi:hypothetical protein